MKTEEFITMDYTEFDEIINSHHINDNKGDVFELIQHHECSNDSYVVFDATEPTLPSEYILKSIEKGDLFFMGNELLNKLVIDRVLLKAKYLIKISW